MTREEIDIILTKYTGRTGSHLDVVKRELTEAGVALKVPVDYGYNDDLIYLKNLIERLGLTTVDPLV